MEECSLGTVQFSSVVQSCLTLCGFTDCSISGFPVHLRHPELTQTHVHRVGDAIQSSHPLLSPSPAFSLSKPQGLFQWVSSWYREGIFHKRVLSSVFRKKWGDENGFLLSVIFLSSFQFSSVAQLCLTLCDSVDCSRPGLPVYYQLPELARTYVHWVHDTLQPSYPLSSPSPPAFKLSQHQGERLLLFHAKTRGFLALGGEEFNLGPEMRLDRSELLCNKVLLKYKGDRESFWHRHQKGAERVPPC